MTGGVMVGFIVLLLVILSVRERVRQYMYREKDWSVIGEGKSSPLSRALVNLVGVAGGIYLSLILLVTFLEIELPEKVHVGKFSLEPLAAVSIFLALVQPYFSRAIDAWKKI